MIKHRRIFISRLISAMLAALSSNGFSIPGETENLLLDERPLLVASREIDIVDFNTANRKFHDPNCIWAQRCTVHCIKISRAEAHKRGGIPCKVCGGGE